jgi:hypothetical protein
MSIEKLQAAVAAARKANVLGPILGEELADGKVSKTNLERVERIRNRVEQSVVPLQRPETPEVLNDPEQQAILRAQKAAAHDLYEAVAAAEESQNALTTMLEGAKDEFNRALHWGGYDGDWL